MQVDLPDKLGFLLERGKTIRECDEVGAALCRGHRAAGLRYAFII
jgi:hypothetical protein